MSVADLEDLVQRRSHITLHSLLTIVSLLFSIVLSVSMKFSPGGRSSPFWNFQNPTWPPRCSSWSGKSINLHNVRSECSIIAIQVLIIMFLLSRNVIIMLFQLLVANLMDKMQGGWQIHQITSECITKFLFSIGFFIITINLSIVYTSE